MNKPLFKIDRKTSVVNFYQLPWQIREFFKAQKSTYYQKKNYTMENVGDYVYIGRPSKWGNPFHINYVTSRDEACKKFYDDVMRPEMKDFRNQIRRELKGKILVCYCFPSACHGDTLAEIAESPMED